MGNYSIKELERLSGIKAHTIRIWEKRYKLVSPRRTKANVRLYSDEDLKRIINVAALNNRGIKVSKISSMREDEINKALVGMLESRPGFDVYIDQLVVAMVDLDEEAFVTVLSRATKEFGFERAIMEGIYPFLEKIGVLWQTGSITPAHEHFVSNLVRQNLITAVASLPIPGTRSKKALLFLPEGEMHELGLLFSHYQARARRIKTYYLGQSVPHNDLKTAYSVHRPEILITSLISSLPASEFEKYIHLLSSDFPDAIILASGLQLRRTAFHIPKNVRPFYKASELPALLDGVISIASSFV
jgi:MerR family transcriptional regulator, light-induced transcriptional regulator